MKTAANTQRIQYISSKDLPPCCPPLNMQVWNEHPRVYLQLTHGKAQCPYCDTQYVLAVDSER